MATILHPESLALPQIESAPAMNQRAEPAPYADGAGIVFGLLLGAALWLVVFAVGFVLM